MPWPSATTSNRGRVLVACTCRVTLLVGGATVKQPHPPWSGGSLAIWLQPAQRPREIAGLAYYRAVRPVPSDSFEAYDIRSFLAMYKVNTCSFYFIPLCAHELIMCQACGRGDRMRPGPRWGPSSVSRCLGQPVGLGGTATAAPADLGHPADARPNLDPATAGGAAAGVASLNVNYGGQVAWVETRTGTAPASSSPSLLLLLCFLS